MPEAVSISSFSIDYRRFLTRFRKLFVAAFGTVILLSGCYVPDDFLAEVRLARNGDYAIVYSGVLTWVPLWEEIREGKLSAEQIRQRTEAVQRDLERDSHFKEITPVGQGRFRVFYERLGRFTGTRQVSFPRRGAEIMILEMRSTGEVHLVMAPKLRADIKQRFVDAGASMSGRVRVITNAFVITSNAPSVHDGLVNYPEWTIYDWKIDSLMGPLPHFIARL